MYRFDIVTLFPNLIQPYFQDSILKIALQKKQIQVFFHNPREYSKNRHNSVDDTPYGGGAGMVLSPQPFFDCIQQVKTLNSGPVIFLAPNGKRLTQIKVERLSRIKSQSLILVAGRYEGLDQRVIDLCVDQQLSIGQYVLSGGELPALVVLEAITRILPDVLGSAESHLTDSFSKALNRQKQHPIYTKPAIFQDLKVPEVLLSGDHQKIATWKKNNLK